MSDLKLDEFQPTPDVGPADGSERSAADLAAVYDVPVHIQAVLGARAWRSPPCSA
jgi:hypothetical protein